MSVRRQMKVDKRGENEKRQFPNRTGDPVVSLKSPLSNSAKKSPASRSKTTQSTSERKPALSIIKDIQPDAGAGQTRRQYTAEEKIRIVLEGLLGEQSVAEICRREGLNRGGGPHQHLLSLDRSAEAAKRFWKRVKSD